MPRRGDLIVSAVTIIRFQVATLPRWQNQTVPTEFQESPHGLPHQTSHTVLVHDANAAAVVSSLSTRHRSTAAANYAPKVLRLAVVHILLVHWAHEVLDRQAHLPGEALHHADHPPRLSEEVVSLFDVVG